MSPFRGLHQIALYASDLSRSTGFYREKVGAEYLATFDPPGLVFFRIGDTRLLLEKAGKQATIYLRVDDIHRSFLEMSSRGVTFLGDPHPIFRDVEGRFGPAGATEWMAFFRDPDDNLVAIVSQIL